MTHARAAAAAASASVPDTELAPLPESQSSQAARGMYSTIGSDYFGIRVNFNHAPISGLPFREFVFSGHELLVMLLQSCQKIYEIVLPQLHFTASLNFPLKAISPFEWLDFAQLLRDGKHHPKTPKLVLDLGGRKIIVHVPSDKYCYDYGELSLYTVRANVPSPTSPFKTGGFILNESVDIPTDDITNPDAKGKEPVLSEGGKERLSYIDFYKALKTHYTDRMDDSVIVKECRRILSGHRLNSRHAKVLPLMAATMLGAEVSRNRACLVTGLMLLDLIESNVLAPSGSGNSDVYCFKNVLWHPELYDSSANERRTDPGLHALNGLGGFHPMAHQGSWEKEFHKEGPYQQQSQLTLSHIKSVVILIDWLSHFRSNEFTVTKLNQEEHRQASQEFEETMMNNPPQRGVHQVGQLNKHILVNFIHPYIASRFSSFDCMLPLVSASTNVDANDALPSPEQLHYEKTMARLNQEADDIVEEMKAKNAVLREAYLRRTDYNPEIDKPYEDEIEENSHDVPSCVAYLNRSDSSFTAATFQYCSKNTVGHKELVTFFVKLTSLCEPTSLSLGNMLVNMSPAEKSAVYKLIFSSSHLFKKFSAAYTSVAAFISRLSNVTPLDRALIEILLDKETAIVLNTLSGNDLYELCEGSRFFSREIMINFPTLFLKIINCMPHFKIAEIIGHLMDDNQYSPTAAEWESIFAHNYRSNINSLIRFLISRKQSASSPFQNPVNNPSVGTLFSHSYSLSSQSQMSAALPSPTPAAAAAIPADLPPLLADDQQQQDDDSELQLAIATSLQEDESLGEGFEAFRLSI